MNKQTYEALKRVWKEAMKCNTKYNKNFGLFDDMDLLQIQIWLNEVAKEYQEGGEQE